MTGTALAPIKARLPQPDNTGIDPNVWPVLTNAIFPNARSAESILLAFQYCRVRSLDILKKPVNIVPIWDQRANNGRGAYVETIWPSIHETQATAARTGQWAGMDEPVWGPDVTREFVGERKDYQSGGKVEEKVPLTFPEWCAVKVYRVINNERCAFVEPVYWLESYARIGGGELPNEMWRKRPHGQLHKNAKAASLRAAFPEEGGGYDEAEIEGITVPIAPEAPEPPKPKDNWQPPPASQTSDQRGDRKNDQGGNRQPEPPPHDEAPPQGERVEGNERSQASAGPPAEYVDTATGAIGPQAIPVQEKEPWADWGLRYLNAVKTSRTAAEVDAWAEKNESALNAMKEQADKVHARLTAAIGRHLLEITPPERKPGENTIIGAG